MKTIHKCLTAIAVIFALPAIAAPAQTAEKHGTGIEVASIQSDKSNSLGSLHQSGCGCAACQQARQMTTDTSDV